MAAADDCPKKKGKVSKVLSEWLIVALLVFTIVVETILHKIEHWIKHKHAHLSAVVNVLYRELMILGIISFTFVIYELAEKPSKDIILSFEYAHLFIFLLAVFYTFVVLSVMYASLRLSASWKQMEQIDLVEYLHLKGQYTNMRHEIHKHQSTFWRKIHWWFPNVNRLIKYQKLHELMAFHDIRFQVIFYRNLPENFRFSSFLRRIKAVIFVELVESHLSIKVLFLAFVLADIARRYIMQEKKGSPDSIESILIVSASGALIFIIQMLSWKIRKIFWELTKHPRVYFEGVEAQAVEQELETRLEEGRIKPKVIDSGDESEINPNPKKSLDWEQAASVVTSVQNTRQSMESVPPPQSLGSNQRYSLELPPEFKDHENKRNSVENHTTTDDHKTEVVIPAELQETAARHSLELVPPGAGSRYTGAPKTTNRGAVVAHEAIQAARRRSIDNEMNQPLSINSAQMMISSRGGSVDGDALSGGERRSLDNGRRSLESGRRSLEGFRRSIEGGRRSLESGRRSIDSARRSIDLVAAIPRDELIQRHNIQTTADGGQNLIQMDNTNLLSSPDTSLPDLSRPGLHVDPTAIQKPTDSIDNIEEGGQKQVYRSKSLGFLNNTIMKNLEVQQNARNAEPEPYPWIVLKVLPRLGRVASPVEKLFWLGSHRLFMWCVELTLFFSTVILAAASASLSLAAVEGPKILPINIAAVVVSFVTLLYILLKSATILKKYIFILHNASLVPEALALDAIHNVNQKRPFAPATWSDYHSDSEGEEEDAEAAAEQRSKIGNLLRTEAEQGHVRGIEGNSGRLSSASADAAAARRAEIRKRAAQNRRRVRSDSESLTDLPSAREPIYIPSGQP